MTKLDRYGIEWTGPKTPISVPMPDGYWTPWHLAQERIAELEKGGRVRTRLEAERESRKRIVELESREQHLLGVIFSVSKVSFEAGAIHQGNDLHSDSIWFARKMHTKHKEGDL
jgi:hypothetical protein